MQKNLIKGYRLSPQQEHLWLLQQDNQSLSYRAHCAVLIEGNLNIKALKAALENVINRHEILRTTFYCLPEMAIPVQVITDRHIPLIHDHDLSGLEPQEQEAKIEALFDEASQRPIDFERDLLLHISLVTLSPSRHMLLVNLPAMNADTATLKNLMREISRSYAVCLHGKELSDKPMQYIVVSEWQNELLEAEDGEIAREYWRKQDISDIFTLKLPFENQPSRKPEFEPQFLNLSVHPSMVSEFRALVRRYNTSAYVFLLTCWQILLWRLIRRSDIIVGTACDGRTDEELEEALGLFAKYLPLHCHLEEHVQFSELLEQVHESTREIYEWQEGFTWKQIRGSDKNNTESYFWPLCFDFEKQPEKCSNADVTFSIYKQYACVDRFKVKLSCVDRDDSLSTEFHYDPNLFLLEDIKRLAGQFYTLLENVLNNPEAALGELEILNDVERQQLLVEFNNTKTDYPIDKCIHHLFEEQAERTPDAVAVVFEAEQLTYRELHQRANQLAHHLQTLGVGLEVRVGICVERSLEMVIGILGILKAGGAYVPLDPAYPQERLAFMLKDAQAPVLLTQQRLVEEFPEHGAQVVCLDTGWEAIARKSVENPAHGVTTDNLAYVMYTSGSTGQPKGAMISHRALCNHMLWMGATWPITEKDRVLQKTPISFDASVWEFFAPLIAGARLIMARPEGHKDSVYLVDTIAEHNVTVLKLVPSMLQVLLEEPKLEQCHCLRHVYCGGEALPIELQQRFSARLGAELYNLYGPTEACIDVTSWACERESKRRTVPIGRPIANTQIYILDRHLQPVPIGVAGELHIGGASLARGYLNRPELTSEKFIPHPFSDEPGARLYKTGDLARYLSDGNIEFLGRIDQQVKLRGFRIELGEIEAVLVQHPEVREAVVIAREDQPGDKRLVAYFVLDQELVSTTSELRRFLREKLPEYMVPAALVMLEALPLMPNGKIDRCALPAANSSRSGLEAGFVAPRTPTQEVLAAIWAEVLGLEQIGIHDNFFELGGHSLLATQLISRVRNTFSVELPLRSLFEAPTVAGLALAVAQSRDEQKDSCINIIDRINRGNEEQLLAKLAQLSDEEVNSLLGNMLAEEEITE